MGFLFGSLIGGASAYIAVLFLAPQTGEELQNKLIKKSYDLRIQAIQKAKEVAEEVENFISDQAQK